MANTQTRLALIIQDLKSSNYFRVWALLWACCFVIWWVGLGFMADKAHNNEEHNYQRSYVINKAPTIPFPSFFLRVGSFQQSGPIVIDGSTSSCSFGGLFGGAQQPLLLNTCPSFNGTNTAQNCAVVNTQNNNGVSAVASSSGSFFNMAGITCTIQTQNNQPGVINDLLAFQEIGSSDGPNGGAFVWIAPNANAWVLLTLSYYDGQPQWDRELLYHSDIFHPTVNVTQNGNQVVETVYNITVLMNTFQVVYYESYDFYSSFLTASDIGGFAFLLIIIHKVVMLAVGFVLENNSQFLNSFGEGAKYQSV